MAFQAPARLAYSLSALCLVAAVVSFDSISLAVSPDSRAQRARVVQPVLGFDWRHDGILGAGVFPKRSLIKGERCLVDVPVRGGSS